jgi:hypothetical protein
MPRALVGLFRGPAQPSSGLRASDRSHSARESEGALGWTWDPRVRQTGATAGWRHVGCSANRFSPLTRSPRWRSNAAAEHPHASAGARRGRLASTCERRGGYVFAEARSAHGTRRSSQRRHTCRGVRGDRRNGRHGRMEACGLLREPLLDGTGDGCDGHQPLDAGIAGSQRAHTPLVPGAFSPSHEGSLGAARTRSRSTHMPPLAFAVAVARHMRTPRRVCLAEKLFRRTAHANLGNRAQRLRSVRLRTD